jgi:hypothetical protein
MRGRTLRACDESEQVVEGIEMYSLALENEVMAALPDLPDPRRGDLVRTRERDERTHSPEPQLGTHRSSKRRRRSQHHSRHSSDFSPHRSRKKGERESREQKEFPRERGCVPCLSSLAPRVLLISIAMVHYVSGYTCPKRIIEEGLV